MEGAGDYVSWSGKASDSAKLQPSNILATWADQLFQMNMVSIVKTIVWALMDFMSLSISRVNPSST